MNPSDMTPSAPTPVTEVQYVPRDETKKLSFWVSQIFILLATVMGVYLASSQGFKQALAYGDVQAMRSNYYLRKSLQSEIADNIPLVREYMKRLETGGLPARKAAFSLDTFVWESLKSSSATLETPPELLRESRQFYRGVADLHTKIVDNTYGVKVANEKLEELISHMEKDVLPMFDKDIAALRNELKNRGVTVQ